MKQRKVVSMIGALVVLISAVFMMTGCPTGGEPQKEKPVEPKKSFIIKYDLSECTYSSFDYQKYWKLKDQKVKEGTEITLAQDGSESNSSIDWGIEGKWKAEYVKHKTGKYIKGWSKNKDGSTKDYNFGQKIKPAGNMTLYPALSKYGMGDVIDGKTIIYVRNGAKDKIFCKDKYKEYSVTGTDWRYIAVDVSAAKKSEKRQWSSSSKNIITSDAIGAGKENVAKIIADHSDDTDANNAAKYCQKISTGSYLPSEAEAFLIHNAVCSGKITDLPTHTQEEKKYLGPQFGYSIHAYFWTSTQSDKDNAYAVSLFKYDGIWGGEKTARSKTEAAAEEKAAYICPIFYYDDDGNAVN